MDAARKWIAAATTDWSSRNGSRALLCSCKQASLCTIHATKEGQPAQPRHMQFQTVESAGQAAHIVRVQVILQKNLWNLEESTASSLK
jgi:hypothetical protein